MNIYNLVIAKRGIKVMKNTGIVRKIDEVGRIVIPKEVRRILDINVGTALEIFVVSNGIILSRYYEKCVICEGVNDLRNFKNKKVCQNCINNIKNR